MHQGQVNLEIKEKKETSKSHLLLDNAQEVFLCVSWGQHAEGLHQGGSPIRLGSSNGVGTLLSACSSLCPLRADPGQVAGAPLLLLP